MTGSKSKRKTSTSRAPASTSTSPALSSVALPADVDLEADHKLALALSGQVKPRSRSAKPISATAQPTPSTSSAKPVSTSSQKESANGGSKRKAKSAQPEDNKQQTTHQQNDGQRKTSRSAASAARQKNALAVRGRGESESVESIDEDEANDGEDDEEDSGETRCVCGQETDELASGLMIECDICKCWQHGPCVGLFVEKDCPETYYCELCKPNLHGPNGAFKRSHRKQQPAAATHRRSPSVNAALPAITPPAHTTHVPPAVASASRSRARESADTATANGLAADHATEDTKPVIDGTTQPTPNQKRRSTMNSRDAGLEEAIRLSMLEAGAAAATGASAAEKPKDGSPDGEEAEPGTRRRRADSIESAGESSKRQRLSLDGQPALAAIEDGMDVDEFEREGSVELGLPTASTSGLDQSPPQSSKPKHPNQYTYRAKPPSAAAAPPPPAPAAVPGKRASPVKKPAAPTMAAGVSAMGPPPTAPLLNGADLALPPLPTLPTPVPSSRNGGVARARGDGGASAARDLENGGWGVPEHLKHLKHLLPTAVPGFLDVPSAGPDQQIDDGAEGDSSSGGSAALGGGWIGVTVNKREPSTRVRFPGKRITMPEMRKRAKNVLEYLARVQVEMSDREKRVEQMDRSKKRQLALAGKEEQQQDIDAAREKKEVDAEKKEESLRMMDLLSKDVLLFQQKYFGAMD